MKTYSYSFLYVFIALCFSNHAQAANTIFEIKLNKGWNFIAIPVTGENEYTAEELLASINAEKTSCDGISKFDTEDQEWRSFTPNSKSASAFSNGFVEDFPIVPGHAYQIRCLRRAALTLSGQELDAMQPFSPRRNSLGYVGAANTNASTLCDRYPDRVKQIARWMNGGWEEHICGLPFNNFQLSKTEGYFVEYRPKTSIAIEVGSQIISLPVVPVQPVWASQICDEYPVNQIALWQHNSWRVRNCAAPFQPDFELQMGQGYHLTGLEEFTLQFDGQMTTISDTVTLDLESAEWNFISVPDNGKSYSAASLCDRLVPQKLLVYSQLHDSSTSSIYSCEVGGTDFLIEPGKGYAMEMSIATDDALYIRPGMMVVEPGTYDLVVSRNRPRSEEFLFTGRDTLILPGFSQLLSAHFQLRSYTPEDVSISGVSMMNDINGDAIPDPFDYESDIEFGLYRYHENSTRYANTILLATAYMQNGLLNFAIPEQDHYLIPGDDPKKIKKYGLVVKALPLQEHVPDLTNGRLRLVLNKTLNNYGLSVYTPAGTELAITGHASYRSQVSQVSSTVDAPELHAKGQDLARGYPFSVFGPFNFYDADSGQRLVYPVNNQSFYVEAEISNLGGQDVSNSFSSALSIQNSLGLNVYHITQHAPLPVGEKTVIRRGPFTMQEGVGFLYAVDTDLYDDVAEYYGGLGAEWNNYGAIALALSPTNKEASSLQKDSQHKNGLANSSAKLDNSSYLYSDQRTVDSLHIEYPTNSQDASRILKILTQTQTTCKECQTESACFIGGK